MSTDSTTTPTGKNMTEHTVFASARKDSTEALVEVRIRWRDDKRSAELSTAVTAALKPILDSAALGDFLIVDESMGTTHLPDGSMRLHS